jgi:hypothetical protein
MTLKTCQNPLCKVKYKNNNDNYCSKLCFNKYQHKKRIEKHKPWKYFWEIMLQDYPFTKMTQEEFNDYYKVWRYYTFVNNKS